MRGLKSVAVLIFPVKSQVASLVDAWIEILLVFIIYAGNFVASLVDAWIEIVGYKPKVYEHVGRIPCGCVD